MNKPPLRWFFFGWRACTDLVRILVQFTNLSGTNLGRSFFMRAVGRVSRMIRVHTVQQSKKTL